MTRRPMIGVGAVAVAVTVTIALVLAMASPSVPLTGRQTDASADPSDGESPHAASASPPPTEPPIPKHELFGFVPYWEMNGDIAKHLEGTPLTTLALFSVTTTKTGKINTSQLGYRRITGSIGQQLIREAHHRGVAVQLVFTSFGTARNARFFTSPAAQDAAIASLVALAARTHVDGINVDVEGIGVELLPPYAAFVGRLREALRAEIPKAQVSVATGAGPRGAPMAAAAAAAGADRIFMMAYDYHYGASDVGASAPMDRRDGNERDLVWSLDLYESLGVPVDRTILGLPLYGMRWRVAGPEIGAPRLGDGAIWVPADNPKFLANPPLPPELDPIEIVEFYAVPPTVDPVPGDSRATAGWQAIYVDSPRTLEPKLALADDRGLAGAGFWAIGYERGMPEYTKLMAKFADGGIQ
jgi:spore germination protein YaaH